LISSIGRGLGLYAPRLEPVRYAPLEANACELPVVGVTEGGLRETIVDGVNGLLVDPPVALAEGIERSGVTKATRAVFAGPF